MNAQTRRISFQGPAGTLEALQDDPVLTDGVVMKGVAVIAHPHPLFSGTMENKVVQTVARAFVQCGWRAVRFNFRGVGASDGVYDEGRGELQDLLAVVEQSTRSQDGVPAALALGGFSFGAFVVTNALAQLPPERAPKLLVLVGTAASRFSVAQVPESLHSRTLVLHGEVDDTVPLADVMQWARPQMLPVTVIPGVAHFFHGQLPLLRSVVVRHLQSVQ
jgi:alpha/beta superfamily hydrolase